MRAPSLPRPRGPAACLLLLGLQFSAGARVATWESFGLPGTQGTSLRIAGQLYATTLGDEVYRPDLFSEFTEWISLGLAGN